MATIKVGERIFEDWANFGLFKFARSATRNFESYPPFIGLRDIDLNEPITIIFAGLENLKGLYDGPTTFDNFDQAKQTVDEFLLRVSKLGAFE